jgi:hypothetical protein
MTEPYDDPPRRGSADGSKVLCFPAANPSPLASKSSSLQVEILPFPRHTPRPRRSRRIAVQISAADGLDPIGRTRALDLTHDDLVELIAAAMRMEARASCAR